MGDLDTYWDTGVAVTVLLLIVGAIVSAIIGAIVYFTEAVIVVTVGVLVIGAGIIALILVILFIGFVVEELPEKIRGWR